MSAATKVESNPAPAAKVAPPRIRMVPPEPSDVSTTVTALNALTCSGQFTKCIIWVWTSGDVDTS